MPVNFCKLKSSERQFTNLERELFELDKSHSWNIFYEEIQNRASTECSQLQTSIANKTENKLKNRYRNIIPYNNTRVTLQSASSGDYINANFVKATAVPFRLYILTQGPLSLTAGHFWQMVWEHRCPVIIMLNCFIEGGAVKCFKYFPVGTETLHFPDAELLVTCINETPKVPYTLRNLKITNTSTNESRNVLHFHYTNWPDFGVPDCSSTVLNFLWDVRRTGKLDDPNRPCVVHCSAGVGRSGAFALIDLALAIIEKQNSFEGVSLSQLLVQLRQCRMGIIQTPQQLRFSYLTIIEGGKRLLSTPLNERSALVFSELNEASQCLNDADCEDKEVDAGEEEEEEEEADTTDSDDEADSEDDNHHDEVIKRKVPKGLKVRATQPKLLLQSDYAFAVDVSTSSAEEVEIRQLLNQRFRKTRKNHHFRRCNLRISSVEIEEVRDSEDNRSQKMSSNCPPNNSTGDAGFSTAMRTSRVNGFAADSAFQKPRVRLVYRAPTKPSSVEISPRIGIEELLRRLWLRVHRACPHYRCFTFLGYVVDNVPRVLIFSLGAFTLLCALGLGLWWRQQ